MSKTKLYFNVLLKRVSRLHQNNPFSFLPKYHSFTAYCASKCTSTKFVRVYACSYVCHSPLSYLWTMLVRARALIPWQGFNLISQQSSSLSTPNLYQTSSTVHSGINLFGLYICPTIHMPYFWSLSSLVATMIANRRQDGRRPATCNILA